MNGISKVQIRHFTIQKKCDVEFGPYVTTLTGSSFTGKSTILRAIKFVCMNKPSGDKMISWGADKTSVRLIIDGKKITRRKGKGINSYKLSGYKDPFKAFGKGNVPQPIADLVNMADLNFQGQHDKPFWFCESPPEVSRQLNSIVNLEVIDRTLSNIDGGIRDAKADIKLTTKRLEKAEEEKKELAFASSLDADLIYIEELEEKRIQITSDYTTLHSITQKATRQWATRKNAAEAVSGGDRALEKGRIWRKILESATTLKNHVKTGLSADRIIKAAPPDTELLDRLKQQWKEAWDEIGYLEDTISDIKNSESMLQQEDSKFQYQLKELRTFEKTMERCPLCGNKKKKL